MPSSKGKGVAGKNAQQARVESPSAESEWTCVSGYDDAHDYEDQNQNLSWEWSTSKVTYEPRIATQQPEQPAEVQAQPVEQHHDNVYRGPLPPEPAPGQDLYIKIPPQTSKIIFQRPQHPGIMEPLEEDYRRLGFHDDHHERQTHLDSAMPTGFAPLHAPSYGGIQGCQRQPRLAIPTTRHLYHDRSNLLLPRRFHDGTNELPGRGKNRGRRAANAFAQIPAAIGPIHSLELTSVMENYMEAVEKVYNELSAVNCALFRLSAMVKRLEQKDAENECIYMR
ncbi:hypothetical protein N0V83_009206 [Neocucurbitaria cava]|uniref:Uncharacterized protein n=1 Tax=Neocucurbitaria cava TaxID=798079 RepID=A0A9W8Y0H3_9PLEO|nr:hypothetical protein N0V83_009206 [Neocucurbitaria cava]